MGKIPVGSVVELTETNLDRRQYMNYLFMFSIGYLSLTQLIGRVAGDDPEGEPLVQVKGIDGRPLKTKIIGAERKRRYEKFNDIDFKKLKDEYPILSMTPWTIDDRDNLGVKIGVLEDDITGEDEKELENEISLPVGFEYLDAPTETTKEADVAGGNSMYARDGFTPTDPTTITLITDHFDYESTLICTEHQLEDNEAVFDHHTSEHIADEKFTNSDTDAAACKVKDGYNFDHYETVDLLRSVNGFWTATGIDDEIDDNGSIPVETVGHTSGYTTTDAVEYKRNASWGLEYQVLMDDDVTDHGDSGAPWMEDSEPYLVGAHIGTTGDPVSIATAAHEFMVSVYALSP